MHAVTASRLIRVRLPRSITWIPILRCHLLALSDNSTKLNRKDQMTEETMTRSIPAIAAALLAGMTAFSSAAEAVCISCDYIPVVVRGQLNRGVVGHYSYERYYYRPHRYRRSEWRRRHWRRRHRHRQHRHRRYWSRY